MSIRATAPTGIAASCVSRIPARFASCLVAELGMSRTGAEFQRSTVSGRAVSKMWPAQSAYVRKWVPDRRTATTNLASSSARGHVALRRTGSGRAVLRTPYPDALLRSVNLSPVNAMDYVRTRVANLCRKNRLAEQRHAACRGPHGKWASRITRVSAIPDPPCHSNSKSAITSAGTRRPAT